MTTRYTPDMGDVVWLHFDPQAGHEQAGHRPALVLTPARYNSLTGLLVCCPMTSRIKAYPFEVLVSEEPPSAVLVDQVKSVDWRARGATRKDSVSDIVLSEVQEKIRAALLL